MRRAFVAMKSVSNGADKTNTKVVRGACPIMNALANAGYINNSGDNLSINLTTKQVANATGLPRITLQGALLYTFFRKVTSFNVFNFSLMDISTHGIIEHDNSISRENFSAAQSDPSIISRANFQEYLDLQRDGYIYQSDIKKLKDIKYRAKPNASYIHDKLFPTIENAVYFIGFGTDTPSGDCRVTVEDFEKMFLHEEIPKTFQPKKPVPPCN